MQENKKLSSETSELGNVDQIREILFGSQSRELNKRFEKLEIDIKRSFDDLKSKIEFSQKEFNQKLENEVELISKRIKNLTTVQQDEFADIKDNNLNENSIELKYVIPDKEVLDISAVKVMMNNFYRCKYLIVV